MRVAVVGAQSVAGHYAVPEIENAGHEVVSVGRDLRSVLDVAQTAEDLRGCDAVVNLSAQFPVGLTTRRHRAWKTQDLIRSEGVRRLVEAARLAGVRRVVHQSSSVLYADQGSDWITERSPVGVTAATEPSSVGEMVVQDYASCSRVGVVLRMGVVMGDSTMTRWTLRASANGRPIGLGAPDGFAHLLHSDDVGSAINAALEAPSGVYNVGAEPVRRAALVDGFAAAVGRERGEFLSPWMARFAGYRFEPLARSLRVSSSTYSGITGWAARRNVFDLSWFEASGATQVLAR